MADNYNTLSHFLKFNKRELFIKTYELNCEAKRCAIPALYLDKCIFQRRHHQNEFIPILE